MMYSVMQISQVGSLPELDSIWDDEATAQLVANMHNKAFQTKEFYVVPYTPDPEYSILDRQYYDKERGQWLCSDR